MNLQQLTAMRQISQDAMKRARMYDREDDQLFGDNDGAAGKAPVGDNVVTLWSLGIPKVRRPLKQGEQEEGDREERRFLYLVFQGMPHQNLGGLIRYAESGRAVGQITFFLTNNYRQIDPTKYYCKLRLKSATTRTVLVRKWAGPVEPSINDATNYTIDGYIGATFMKGVFAETCTVLRDVSRAETAEFQIRFPDMLTTQLTELFEMVTCPIIPKDLHLLLEDTGQGGAPILDRLDSAVHSDESPVIVSKGTRLYVTSGNSSLPFGTHTNVNSPQFNVNALDSANKKALETFIRLYPSWGSFTMSTHAPVRSVSMNGTSFSGYVVNENYKLVDGRMVKRATHIVADPRHPINGDFRARLHELVAKINSGGGASAEERVLVVWGAPPADADYSVVTGGDNVDIVTFHSAVTQTIAAKHRDMFVCNEAAGRTFARIEFVDGIFPVYNTDFDRFKLLAANISDLPFGGKISTGE